jgi:vacuolar-type H+-ATPase subunit C/Vma6
MTIPEDIPYLNARIRGRKSRLLGLERLRALARSPSVEELTVGLAATPYASDLSRASALEPATHRAAELAFGENLAQDFSRVRQFLPEMGASPARYLFSCWDLRNLKAVLRGVHAREAPERTGAVCTPGGWIPPSVWAELARSGSLEEAVERSVSMDLGFREALQEGWAAYRQTHLVASLEERLDRQFFGNALRALESVRGACWRPLDDLIRFDIDARNLSALLEWLHRLEQPTPELVVPGGRCTGERIVRELSSDADLHATVRRCLVR